VKGSSKKSQPFTMQAALDDVFTEQLRAELLKKKDNK
jgi:hypothetical protein